MTIDERKQQILDELKQYSIDYLPGEPTDITINDIKEQLGVEYRQAANVLSKLAKKHPDKYKKVLVKFPNNTRSQYVLRPLDGL